MHPLAKFILLLSGIGLEYVWGLLLVAVILLEYFSGFAEGKSGF